MLFYSIILYNCSPPGVYVEKVGDGSAEGPYTGLLGIGDEILQVNGEAVAGLSMDQVTRLMTRESTASLRIMPARSRQRWHGHGAHFWIVNSPLWDTDDGPKPVVDVRYSVYISCETHISKWLQRTTRLEVHFLLVQNNMTLPGTWISFIKS